LADQSFAANDLEKAKMNYQEALKFKPNESYPKGKLNKIDELLADKAKLQQTENEFLALVGKGDAAFDQKEYITAKTNYTSALDLKPSAADVKSKIKNIDSILQKLADDKKKEDDRLQALAAAQEKAYSDAIAKGNKQFALKTYPDARITFLEAKKIKPAESLPDEMIAKIDAQIASDERELAEARQKEEANQKAIKDAQERSFVEAMIKADNAYIENDFKTAKTGYETALAIKAGDQNAKRKLGLTEGKLAELARLTQAYNTAINDANKFVTDKRYQEAKDKYQEALKYLPGSEYPQAQIKKLDDLLAQAEANRQKDELYASSVKEGEALFKNKEYSGARLSFVKASELKPAEPLPASRIKEIDKLLADQALAEAKNKTIEQAYQESIKRADKAFDDKEYSPARLIYGEALSIKPNEQYPKGKITEIDKLVADLKLQQYQQAIAAGDQAFKTDLLDEATTQYELALTTRANDPYAKKQLGEITKRRATLLDEQNRLKKLNEQYDALMADAKSNFDGKEYQKAKLKYQSASLLKPTETLPKDQIAIIDGLLKEIMNAEETNRLYAESIKNAQDAFRLNKLKEALDAYQKAHDYKPSEPVPPARIAEISAMIAQQEEAAKLLAMNKEQQLAKERANKEQYDKAITDADEAFKGKQYKDSRSLYTTSLSIFPIEKYPRSQISKIDILIAQQLKDELLARQQATKDSIANAKNAAFDQAMASAKELEQSKQYQNAIQKYRDAISFKPDERSNIQKLILSLEDRIRLMDKQNRQYSIIIAKADQLFAGKKWTESLTEYNNAANIKTDEDYPKKQITEIQRIVSEQKAAYDNAIANADKAFDDSDWQNAKAGYTEALLVKPNEVYPQKRLKETNQKINEEKLAGINKQDLLAQSQHDLDEKYRQAISVADNAFREKTYVTARLRYIDAQNIKPDESYPKNQIILIDQLLNKTNPVEAPIAQELPAKQTEKPVSAPSFNTTLPAKAIQGQTYITVDRYEEAIRKADEAFGKKEYTGAKFYYYNALGIKPSEKYPKDKIHEILMLINSLLSERLENEYRDLITSADEAYTQKDLAHARFYYSKAMTIKTSEEYPRIKLKDIQKLIDQDTQDKLNIEYNKLIELADQAMQNKNYGIARSNYNKALSLKPNEKYPKDQMKLIKEALGTK
jgi:tetratricopeptide (TPR) repeat protein